MSEELKPCPICGGSNLSICDHGGMVHHEYRIECNYSGCSCLTGVRTKEEAIAAWNALPRRLRWTKERPTKTGFYWWRNTAFDSMATIVAVDIENRASIIIGSEKVVDFTKVSGEWAGPIPEPEEATT